MTANDSDTDTDPDRIGTLYTDSTYFKRVKKTSSPLLLFSLYKLVLFSNDEE